jgi:ElaB/YqjD/DUF883 family membrane-anchored ribosome-binding protein
VPPGFSVGEGLNGFATNTTAWGIHPIETNIFSAYCHVHKYEKRIHSTLSRRNRLMTKDTLTSTRDALIKDTDHLKRDAGQIVEDVKKHASAHVDAVKDKANEYASTWRATLQKEHPLKLVAAALFIGFLIGTFRRK